MRRWIAMCALVVLYAASVRAQTVLCASNGKAYRECRVSSTGTIRMVMEISAQACFEGLTWGTRTPGVVWVTSGCRATFTVTGRGVAKQRGKDRIVCESQKDNREVCYADTSNGVVLVQQLGTTVCAQGRNWGFDEERELIWVDRGCRAEFLLGRVTQPVPPPPTLDSTVVCESENRQRKECKAYTGAGVQIVRHLSDSACGFGREWGYDANGIWVTKGCRAEFVVGGRPKPTMASIECESKDNARNHCAAATQFGVALYRQLGESECVLDQSWGFDADGIWVAAGCHAQFVLGGYRLPADAVPETASRVTCESLDGGDKECAVDTTRGVGLIRQTGDADCVLNRTWGYNRDGIWVTSGCRAEFAVARAEPGKGTNHE
jgi:hypothetical protein